MWSPRYFYNLNGFQQAHHSLLTTVASWVTILGFFGLLFAIYTYYANRRDAKIQTVQAIKYELINAEWYVKLKESKDFKEGYKSGFEKQWLTNNSLSWAHPFSIPNPINYTFAQNYNLLPGIGLIDGSINKVMPGYIQWCMAYNNFLLHIRAFIFSRNPESNITLAIKLESNLSLDPEEQKFVNALLSMYCHLFFGIVGDQATAHLYAHLQDLQKSLDTYEKNICLF